VIILATRYPAPVVVWAPLAESDFSAILPFLAPCGLNGTVTKTKDPANSLWSLKNIYQNSLNPDMQSIVMGIVRVFADFVDRRPKPWRRFKCLLLPGGLIRAFCHDEKF
jgi:hypothetical protein